MIVNGGGGLTSSFHENTIYGYDISEVIEAVNFYREFKELPKFKELSLEMKKEKLRQEIADKQKELDILNDTVY